MATREQYVPLRVGRLTRDLVELPWPDGDRPDQVRSFSQLVSALFHFEFHDREQQAVETWDAVEDGTVDGEQIRTVLADLLAQANYLEVTLGELRDAIERESLVPLRLDVDLDDYEDLLVFRRGSRTEEVERKRWFGLRSSRHAITVEDRVVVFSQTRSQAWFDEQGIDPAKRDLVPGQASLKQFKNVPRADIGMLLPSTRVRFRTIDTVAVGLPALISGIAVLATKLLPTLGLMFLLVGASIGLRKETPELDQGALVLLFGGLLAMGGFFVRQWTKLKNRRVQYLKTLSEALYFRTTADGAGVLHTLLHSAEQQEVVEVLLAYRFLRNAPDGLEEQPLDEEVEAWLRETCNADIDFEVDDALRKLRELDLLVEQGATLRVVPLAEALASLDDRWDDLFRFGSNHAPTPVGAATEPEE